MARCWLSSALIWACWALISVTQSLCLAIALPVSEGVDGLPLLHLLVVDDMDLVDLVELVGAQQGAQHRMRRLDRGRIGEVHRRQMAGGGQQSEGQQGSDRGAPETGLEVPGQHLQLDQQPDDQDIGQQDLFHDGSP